MSALLMIPNVFVLVEGRTEEIYLNHLKVRGSNYTLHVERFDGNQPMKMVKRCAARFKERGMSRKYGDRAFCVLDVDNNSVDDLRVAMSYAGNHGIDLVISNPCFEVFFLLHFQESVPLKSSLEIKEDTKSHIKGYKETMDCWHLLLKRKDKALERSRCFNGIDDVEAERTGSNLWMLFDALDILSGRNRNS